MIKTSLFIVFAVAAMAQSDIKLDGDLSSGVGVLDSGVTLTYKTHIAVALPPRNALAAQLRALPIVPLGSGFSVSGNTMRHFIYDKAAQSYSGYDMVITATADPKRFVVAFQPLTVGGMVDALKAVAGGLPLTPAPPKKYPAPQWAYDGDAITLDVMISSDGRERIVDYIKLTAPPKPVPPPAVAAAEPRDLSLDDGPVNLSTEPPLEVLINGEKFSNTVTMTSRGGATLGFYFPGHGRYILSLAPHDGFAKLGTVRANIVAFQSDGRQYEIQFREPIAGSDKAWNLYVLHDPAYLPKSNMVDFVLGAVDRLENLLPKRL